ncbi:hypothetical protein DFH09DRAFT_1335274 [Mycena vulgaris]|nr:hypothetical protein DFH09DRAFT_1335274 [Mycena vulgaris]
MSSFHRQHKISTKADQGKSISHPHPTREARRGLRSILDDKLFIFWHLQGYEHPFAHINGLYRYEIGINAAELRDLRVNPRCLESQLCQLPKILATTPGTALCPAPATSSAKAEVIFLDAGHFAGETETAEIGRLMLEFLNKVF